ncbi:MAG TPA: PDZ domain-containing protein [Pirellulaceae bacterium]|jgi:serine protease Do|nr:PDZ domain-containing protein [Pirellulaceae bacterium]
MRCALACFAFLLGAASSGLPFLAFDSVARGQQIGDAEQRAFKEATRAAAPFTVRIDTVGGLERIGETLLPIGPFTGTIVSPDGFIVSATYNFLSEPQAILATLPDGRRAAAKIVARDEARMLTLLKVETESPLPVPTAVPRSEMQPGQWTLALGRAYEGELPNLSVGVLSASNRIWGRAIQTDAKISPINYGGPLVDLRGRVLGILVPLSPEGAEPLAGSDWYDSGIGFAVPLEDVFAQLDRLKTGENLKPGVMGIAIKGQDIYSTAVELAAVPPGGPAARAGIKAGDKIVEAEGQPIVRQAQLKHALGALYAGQSVSVVVERKGERLSFDVPLVDAIEPYAFASIGASPMNGEAEGVTLRHVFGGSPAEEAGLKSGDRVTKVGETAVASLADLYAALLPLQPGAEVELGYVRGDATQTAKIVLAELNAEAPEQLAPLNRSASAPQDGIARGWVDAKLPEDPHVCFAIVPEDYDPAVPHGLLVVFGPPGAVDANAAQQAWGAFARERDFIVLFPQSQDEKEWKPNEIEVLRKLVDQAVQNYSIDRSRIALFGKGPGGAMAYLFTAAHRDLPRGLAIVDAVAPPRTPRLETDPVNRLSFLLLRSAAGTNDAELAEGMQKNLEMLQKLKFPVLLEEQDQALTERWLDAADRF